jgi:hypothetical protein
MYSTLVVNDDLILEAPWTFEVSSARNTKRMWTALGCNDDPTNKAAWGRWQIAIDEIQEIFTRAPEVPAPQQVWDPATSRWVTNPTSKRPRGKDAKRMKELQALIIAEEGERDLASATLPAGTKLKLHDIDLVIRGEAFIKLNVVDTDHSGLRFSQKGGELSRGKRPLTIKATELLKATYTVERSITAALPHP